MLTESWQCEEKERDERGEVIVRLEPARRSADRVCLEGITAD